ncbi:hypothetical protein NZK35_25505 [Stieleria sp. ICT_E10.1]|uniref:hypothetical protein n=1 Tax=Stieleria sedimenti TaxID=2976331 RepID=UPI00217FB354|nr:hypothetical protein [Stieleria sedimenti]MCS7470019.1 hypothetical protein [Stieleria sedimenti]
MKHILMPLILACLSVVNGIAQDAGELQKTSAEPDQGSILAEPLDALEWMVGEWVDKGDDTTIVTKCSWTKNRKFLKRSFELKTDGKVTLHGDQIVGFDPRSNQIRSWTFDSEGGIGEGVWIQDGNRWLVKSSFVLADGSRASSLNVYTYVDDDTFRWQSTNREIAGELQPSIPEVSVVRLAEDDNAAANSQEESK